MSTDLATIEPAAVVAADPITLLREVLGQADAQREALAEAGDWETIVRALPLLKALYSDLATLIRACEDNVAAQLPAKKVEVAGLGVVERRKGTDRKQWQSVDLLDELLRHAAFDTETGEAVDDETILRQRIHEVLVECVPFTGSLGWRVTALRERGIDPDDWCEATPGRTTVQIHGGDAR